MKIIVDAWAATTRPNPQPGGGALAAREYGEEVLLVGDPDKVLAVLKSKGMEHTPGVTIMPASDLVDMHDDPATVLRHKPDSSMAVAFKLLKAGEGDALVSAGNTGALLTGATLYGGRIKGIRRGALAPVMPCKGGQVMLCDAGANTECTAEMLLQFAFLGALYMRKRSTASKTRASAWSTTAPRTPRATRCARRPTRCSKRRATRAGSTLSATSRAAWCRSARATSPVCDGYSGNVMLKTIEGVAKFMAGAIKGVFTTQCARPSWRYLACRKQLMDQFRDLFNPGPRVGGRALPRHRKAGHQGARLVERNRGDERGAAGDRLHQQPA